MKVYPFVIPKAPQQQLIVQEDRDRIFYDRLHQHEEIQLSYLIAGSGKLIVGNSIHHYGPGTLVALGPQLPHLFKSDPSDTESHMMSIFFASTAFNRFFLDAPEMNALQPFFEKVQYGFKLAHCGQAIVDFFHSLPTTERFDRVLGVLQLLRQLGSLSTKSLGNENYRALKSEQGERLQTAYDYVMQHFQHEIELSQVAEKVFMTPNAFCRFFKQRTRKTFFQFVMEVRITHACQQLIDFPEYSIAEVATRSGFPTISNFNKYFKQFKHQNPSAYRKAMLSAN
ncbi:AraC family transcriptional regulator [Flagellimonas sp. DF-77]|uniref:AraC family transcriptional regulator n=1 Tax=Flagellimonas algarum TaxID=3230298 RepID=UPI0033916B4F